MIDLGKSVVLCCILLLDLVVELSRNFLIVQVNVKDDSSKMSRFAFWLTIYSRFREG